MALLCKVLLILFIIVNQNHFGQCDGDDLNINVDGFMDAFDNAYPTETSVHVSGLNEAEVPAEVPDLAEASLKTKEEPVIKERMLPLGENVQHTLTENVQTFAENILTSISSDLRLVKVTGAASTTYPDKVQRELSLVVSRHGCAEGDKCEISCRVELVSGKDTDHVTWHNCLDTQNGNEIVRTKRGAVGGFKQVDENEAKELADVAVQTLDSIDADDIKRVVTRVIRAQKQLVNGIMYHLTLEVASSDCKEDSPDCEGGALFDHQTCKILMQRHFSGEAPYHAQVIKSECSPAANVKETEGLKKRAKRSSVESNNVNNEKPPSDKPHHNTHKMGGIVSEDPNSEKIIELAQFALDDIEKMSNSMNRQKIVRIVDARSQVVAGVKYYLKLELSETDCRKGSSLQQVCKLTNKPLQSCDVVIWDKPWKKFRVITRVSCSPAETRKKRGMLYGGLSAADPNDPKVQEMAQFAVAQLDAKSNSVNKQKLLVVKKAQTQVVAGSNYYLTIQLVETNCRKGTPSDSTCSAAPGKEVQECDVVVYDRPWENHRELTSAKCLDKKQRHKRDVLVGGLSPADPNDAKVQEMAQFAVAQLDAKSNSVNKQKLLVVKKAQTQVVSGTNYYLTIQLVETNCRKGTPSDSKCNAAPGKEVQECDVVVYDRPWENHRELTSAKCLDKKQRHKRDVLVGGLSPADPNDAKVQEMAQFAVAQLDAKSNSVNKQKLLVVKKAQTQVVAGVNYYLTIQLVETNCRKGTHTDSACSAAHGKEVQECDVVVYDRPWDKHRELTSAKCLDKNKQRHKRDVLVGGLSPADPNDAKVQEMAQFAVAQMDAKSNSVNKQKLLVVKKAQTQVVAGTNYYLTIQLVETNCRKGTPSDSTCSAAPGKEVQECDVVVYDRPWDKHQEITSVKCLDKNKQRHKRAAVPGGLSPADPNDAKVQEMAQFAVVQLDAKSNSVNKQKLLVVTKAETQVVAGVNYYLTIQLVETNCRKEAPSNSACSAAPGKEVQECEVVVYDRPWDKHRELTSAKCLDKKQHNKRALKYGGKTDADVNDENVQQMAQFALSQLDERSNSLYKQSLVRITKAQTEVVDGISYYLSLLLEETNCQKGTPTSSKCNAVPGKALQNCDVVVYNRPWEHHRELTKFSCSPASETKHLHKRTIVIPQAASVRKQLVDLPEVQAIAQEAVKHINLYSDSSYIVALVDVESAKIQDEAGVKTTLKLIVSNTNCMKGDDPNTTNCVLQRPLFVPQECNVTLSYQPSIKKIQVTSYICEPLAFLRKIKNIEVAGPLSPDVLEAANVSLKRINAKCNCAHLQILSKVVHAKVQTDVGKQYFLTVEVEESDCLKMRPKEICNPLDGDHARNTCRVVVWDQPWRNKKSIVWLHCGYQTKPCNCTVFSVNDVARERFELFKQTYNKSYENEVEHHRRFRIFRANLKKIETLQMYEQGTATYGPTMFADLSTKEFKQKYLGLKGGPPPKVSPNHMLPAQIPQVDLPEEFDWREHNAVTPVKNQGQCGSCWAFSVTGNVEGQVALKHGNLISLSEQELVDCDKEDSGCSGGYMTVAYESIKKLGGLELEDKYPYDAEVETCKFNKSEVKATITGYLNITSNETEMARWLVANGPISIGINANAMQFYMGGVSHPPRFLCNKNELDHGVLLAGYGIHNYPLFHKTLPFWIVKNSWGPKWGEQGYYRVYRGDGTCGVNQMASSAIVG